MRTGDGVRRDGTASRGRESGRRRRGRVVAFALVACAIMGGAAPDEAGTLERSVVRVGRGDKARGSCAGVFIDADRVLTAGHCTVDRKQWSDAGIRDLTVVQGPVHYPVLEVRLSPRSPFDERGAIRDLGDDWAVLKVAMPGKGKVRPLPYLGGPAAQAAALTDDELVKAGYDDASGLKVTSPCAPVRLDPQLRSFLFRCGDGLGAGVSGSALLVRSPEGWAVVGLQSGRTDDGVLVAGIAVVPPVAAVAAR